jgi:PAS domain-containing protein
MTNRRSLDLLNRLAAAEERFLRSEFLAPLPRGSRTVAVRVASIVCRLRVEDDFEGWGIFRPIGPATAVLVRPASLTERRRYLDVLPQRRLILCQPFGPHWLAFPGHQADRRVSSEGLVAVRLVEDGQRFETIEARFDGSQFWFEAVDGRAAPATASYLREAFRQRVPSDQVNRPGLTGAQRAGYAIAEQLRNEMERDRTEDRLRQALAHAGADLCGYLERADGLRVEYEVDGERHVSVVGKNDLSVQLAGVCLSGEDAHFDLQSLVGVLREAHGEGVLRIGADNQGLDEEHYWQVHPAPGRGDDGEQAAP